MPPKTGKIVLAKLEADEMAPYCASKKLDEREPIKRKRMTYLSHLARREKSL